MTQITIEVPEDLVGLWGSADGVARDAGQVLVLDALRRHVISVGKAAELLSLSLSDMHALMAEHDVLMLDWDEEELSREFKASERIVSRLSR